MTSLRLMSLSSGSMTTVVHFVPLRNRKKSLKCCMRFAKNSLFAKSTKKKKIKKRGNKPLNIYALIGLVYKNTYCSYCIKNSLVGL